MSEVKTDGLARTEIRPEHPNVLLVTVDRPPVNAMSVDTYRQLWETFESLRERPEIHVAILTGAGDKAFIAGSDVKVLAERTPEITAARGYGSRRTYDAIRNCAVPTIAAVNKAALGAGFIMASVCDFIVSSEKAKFGLPEINVGALGGARHIMRVVPEKVMRAMVMTGDRFDAHYLERLGVIYRVVEHDKLMDAAFELADSLAAKSPRLMRMRKEGMNLAEELPVNEGYRVEQLFTALAGNHPDAKEAARAVAEKRKPVWTK